jgi:hypothetical protein
MTVDILVNIVDQFVSCVDPDPKVREPLNLKLLPELKKYLAAFADPKSTVNAWTIAGIEGVPHEAVLEFDIVGEKDSSLYCAIAKVLELIEV